MKKTIYTTASIAALLFAAPAFAQTTPPTFPTTQYSDIDQNGEDNETIVDQTGGSEGVSQIDQNGDDNFASVDQSEDSPGANSFNVPANTANINQTGDNSRARVEQNSTDAGSNPGNSATITQNSNGTVQGPNGVPSCLLYTSDAADE